MSGQNWSGFGQKISFSEIGPPGFTPPGFGRTLIKINWHFLPPKPKIPPPSLKRGILWGWTGFSCRKNAKIPGAHKTGAAISGPGIAGKQILRTWGLLPANFRQDKKKSTKINFLGPETTRWGWGSSTRRGGGRKVCALARKFVVLEFRREESGMSREFCRDVPEPWGYSQSLCKKSSCAFFVPYNCQQRISAARSFGRSFRMGGGGFGAKFFCEVCGEVFHEVFGLVLLGHSEQKKLQQKLQPKFPSLSAAKLEKFQGKNFMKRFCRGPSPR